MATAILPLFITLVLGGNTAIVGLIEGSADGASSLIKSYAGYFSDKIGKRTPIMYVGYFLTGVFIPAIGFATSVFQVFILRVSAWMGRGARGPPRDALLSESVPERSRGKAFGFQRGFDTLGAVIGPTLALLLIPYLSYSRLFFVTFIPGIISVAVVFALVKDYNRVKIETKTFWASVSGVSREFKLFLVGVGVFGIANFSNVLFTLRAEQVLAPSLGSKEASYFAILLYVILNVIYAASSYPFGALADRFPKRYLLALGYLFFALACILSIFETLYIPLLVAIFIFAGVSVGIVDTLEGTFAADFLHASERGAGYGILQTVNGVGDFVSSTMFGILVTLISPVFGFETVATIAIIGAILLLLLTRTRKVATLVYSKN